MNGSGHVEVSGLRVDPALHEFVTAELVPGSWDSAGWERCHSSICACSRSRTASTSRCRGANARTSSASPSQS